MKNITPTKLLGSLFFALTTAYASAFAMKDEMSITRFTFDIMVPPAKSTQMALSVRVDNSRFSLFKVNGRTVLEWPPQPRAGIRMLDGIVVNYDATLGRQLCAVSTLPVLWSTFWRRAITLNCFYTNDYGEDRSLQQVQMYPIDIVTSTFHLVETSNWIGSLSSIRHIFFARDRMPVIDSRGKLSMDEKSYDLACLAQSDPVPVRHTVNLSERPLAMKYFERGQVLVLVNGEPNKTILDVHGFDPSCRQIWAEKSFEFAEAVFDGRTINYSRFAIEGRGTSWSEVESSADIQVAGRIIGKTEVLEIPIHWEAGHEGATKGPLRRPKVGLQPVQPQQSLPQLQPQ